MVATCNITISLIRPYIYISTMNNAEFYLELKKKVKDFCVSNDL